MLALHAPHRGPALWPNASRAAIAALELGVAASVIQDRMTDSGGLKANGVALGPDVIM